MYTHTRRSVSAVVILLIIIIINGSLCSADEDSVENTASLEEFEEDANFKFGLVVEIYPLDKVVLFEGEAQEVNLIIQANWTQMWNASDGDDIKVLPVWFRCPGVIRVTSDDPSLLEVINGTLDVTGGDFFGINHTVTLQSHHAGPAYQYLQVHWTAAVPITECNFNLDEEDAPRPPPPTSPPPPLKQPSTNISHDDHDHHTKPLLQQIDHNVQSTPTINVSEETYVNETDDNYDDTVDEDDPPTEQSLKSILIPNDTLSYKPSSPKPFNPPKYNVYKEIVPFQVFRRRRETQEASEIHHHHHYDRSDIPADTVVTPKPQKLADILLLDDYKVAVLRLPTTLDTVFVVVVSLAVAFNTFMMGMQVDYKIVWGVLKKPVGPLVGFVSQFMFMPLASFGLGQLIFTDNNLQLGLFTLGCSPGGNGSNFWTLMLKGDLNLSITMTFISTCCAIFMMPFWLYTLGRVILTRGEITIPFLNLIQSLAAFTIPVGIGVVVRHFRPRWAEIGRKLIRPVTLILIILLNVLAVFNSMYIFKAMTWQTIVAGMCVAWGGYLFGGTLAYVCRQKRPQIIAICIETAIQNVGVTFMVLRLSLDQPDADLSAVAPVSQMIVTTFPLFAVYLVIMIRRRILACLQKRRGMQRPTDDVSKDPDVEKPLMITNISDFKSKANDKPAKLDISQPMPLNAASPRTNDVSDGYTRDQNEPLYENYPIGARETMAGETNL